jgi:FkbM family methyltransferase
MSRMPKTEDRAVARAAFLDRAEEFTPVLGVDAEGARYLFSSSDYHIGRSLFVKQSRGEIKLLERAVRILKAVGRPITGGTFIDVGANIGTTTIPALRDYRFKRAIACEPEPENLSLLKLNLVANGLERDVAICPAAIGDVDGEVEFVVFEHRSGRHEVLPPATELEEDPATRMQRKGETITVPQVRLDSLGSDGVFDPDDVTFLWMDAQGHEGQILQGAASLAERGVPFAMELDPEALERHGGIEVVKEVARSYYTHFVSLRRVRGAKQLGFDLEGMESFDAELEWLVKGELFAEVLLLRDPLSESQRGGVPRREASDALPKAAAEDRPGLEQVREPRAISSDERKAFLKEAKELTPLVAADLNGTRFILPADGSDARSLFIGHEAVKLRLLEAVMSVLDELGLGSGARDGTLVQLGAGPGFEVLAALRWHDFRDAVACENEPAAYELLKLNVAANDLEGRVRAIPALLTNSADGHDPSVDFLLERGILDADGAGLVWIEQARAGTSVLGGAHRILESGPPLLIRLAGGRASVDSLVRDKILEKTHTHFVTVRKTDFGLSRTLQPISAMRKELEGMYRKAGANGLSVLVVRT